MNPVPIPVLDDPGTTVPVDPGADNLYGTPIVGQEDGKIRLHFSDEGFDTDYTKEQLEQALGIEVLEIRPG